MPLDMFISIRTVIRDASGKSGYHRSIVSSRVRSYSPSPMTCSATVVVIVFVMLPIFCWLSVVIGSSVSSSAVPRAATHSPCPGTQRPTITPGSPEASNDSSRAASSWATSCGSSVAVPSGEGAVAAGVSDSTGAAVPAPPHPVSRTATITARTTAIPTTMRSGNRRSVGTFGCACMGIPSRAGAELTGP